jgi:hypothetical protein
MRGESRLCRSHLIDPYRADWFFPPKTRPRRVLRSAERGNHSHLGVAAQRSAFPRPPARYKFQDRPLRRKRRSPEAGPGDRLPEPWLSNPTPPSFFVVAALDVVVSNRASPSEPTVRRLRHYAVRLSGEISWATAAPGVREADLVVPMPPARLWRRTQPALR